MCRLTYKNKCDWQNLLKEDGRERLIQKNTKAQHASKRVSFPLYSSKHKFCNPLLHCSHIHACPIRVLLTKTVSWLSIGYVQGASLAKRGFSAHCCSLGTLNILSELPVIGWWNTRAVFHFTKICAWIKPISPCVMCARALFHLRKLFYLASCFYLLNTHTHAHTHTCTLAADPNEVPEYMNKRSAGEWKETWNKKQISNEIITIQTEGEIERQRKRGREGRVATIARNNRAASMEKERWGERAIWTIEPVTGAQWLQCFQLDIIS